MPLQQVLLVVNPISGTTNKDEIIEKVAQKTQVLGMEMSLYLTTGEKDQEAIRQRLEALNPARVLVVGGDGTITLVAELLQNQDIILGIIPAGSANGLATSFELPAGLDETLDVALGPHVGCIDGVRINGKISLHLSDLGLNALLVKNYEEGEMRGKLGYAKEVVKTLSEHEIFRVRITTPEQTLETEAVIVIIANAQKYGTGVNVNPLGNICDGRFELVIAKRIDVIELAKLLTGNFDFDPDVVTMLSVVEADIEILSGTIGFQIDGEYLGEVPRIRADIVPGVLQVAVPENYYQTNQLPAFTPKYPNLA
ncbi:diacylglycerol kinase family lipid kinase [Rhabdobacter roseus]|uniref:YegS/Rv2252/BmrU family lipid kinase n=1 Tax=Rhabdobacter roseus TaxID=1655419 RepID=A0A840TR99_9BACT|nr:diacylglycerol kinase family protein [Rhabdobacter roseus]MBB5283763.1 YegS/Rv2252/BmrU family lipid kinase [Rhabdobacter roseus]